MGKLIAFVGMLWAWLLSLRIGIPGLWLILLYFAFSSFVVFSLSAFQLQQEIKNYKTIDGKTLPVWSVLHLHTEWKSAKGDLDSITGNITQLVSDNINRRREITVKKRDVISKRLQCERLISDFQTKFVPAYVSGNSQLSLESETCNDFYFNIIIAATATPAERKDEYEKLLGTIKAQLLEYRSDNNYISYLTTSIGDADNSIKQLQNEKQKKEVSIEDIAKSDDGGAGGIGDFLNSLSYLQDNESNGTFNRFLPNFSQMPSDMLTLILVMSMGALGGTLHLTQIYFLSRIRATGSEVEATASYYLFRPFLGAVTALAVFILTKAGVLVVTTSAAGTDGATLSPFFIAFLGIISGLLAEQALETIQSLGGRWFVSSARVDQPRWAYRLAEYLGIQNSTPDTMTPSEKEEINRLASVLDVSSTEITDWLSEAKKIPLSYQKLIAVYVKKPAREIFSDIP